MDIVDDNLVAIGDVLERADKAARGGESISAPVTPTGFSPLDTYLSGGLRAGELTLLGGPQGLGKTTFALQLARNVAMEGGTVLYFCFEHDEVTVLARLLGLEAGLRHGSEALSLKVIRQAIDSDSKSKEGLAGRLGGPGGGADAVKAVGQYADRLLVHRSSGKTTSAELIRSMVMDLDRSGPPPLVIVDYLQKVAVPLGPDEEDERMTIVVESLKDLALEAGVPMLAIVAADREGLAAGSRLRIHDLRGSSALAYEADVVLMLNDKYQIVARHHLVYDVANAERFREWVVLTIDKNRGGLDRIDLEFRKHFENGFFDPEGHPVREQLVDERVFRE